MRISAASMSFGYGSGFRFVGVEMRNVGSAGRGGTL